MKNIIYVLIKERVQLDNNIVKISDIADVYSPDPKLTDQVKNMVIYRFGQNSKDKTHKMERQIITSLYVTSRIIGEHPDNMIIPLGETACVTERLGNKLSKPKKRFLNVIKVIFVSILCLVGGAFSIMAFHNDISITNIFQEFYELVTGNTSNGCTVLEISYSLGLMVGIIVFYDHIGKRRLTKDPTPIEVSMRSYEKDMNNAMVESWDRKGKTIDVD